MLILWEVCLIGDLDSVLFDSPLSSVGVAQAAELHAFFCTDLTVKDKCDVSDAASNLLRRMKSARDERRMAYIVSNLRRAISTLGIGCYDFVETILVKSSLQVRDNLRSSSG